MVARERWTRNDIPDQTGVVAVVTGANSGVGYAAAIALAAKGARVVFACRDLEKGEAAIRSLQAGLPSARVELSRLDLADLSSVRDFADEFASRHGSLQILINNAGVMWVPERRQTADGFELQFGVNHLGHFALTGLLLGRILQAAGSRVVTVSSRLHQAGRIDFDDLDAESAYRKRPAYAQSKLANLLFAFELQRRFKTMGADAVSVAAHPGWSATNLQRFTPFVMILNRYFAQPPEMGALPVLYAATAEGVRGGDYFGPGGFQGLWGYPLLVRADDRAYDWAIAERLWRVSEDLTGVRYPGPDE